MQTYSSGEQGCKSPVIGDKGKGIERKTGNAVGKRNDHPTRPVRFFPARPIYITDIFIIGLRRQAKKGVELDDHPVPTEEALYASIASWREHQRTLLPQMSDLLGNEEDSCPAKDVSLLLPSDISEEQRAELGLDDLAGFEFTLREGEACDVIQAIKRAECFRQAISNETRNMKGRERHQTRNASKVTKANKLLSFWMDEYNAIRAKLLALGMSSDDKKFRPLSTDDTKKPSGRNIPSAGSGGKVPGWIWQVNVGDTTQEPKDLLKGRLSFASLRLVLVSRTNGI